LLDPLINPPLILSHKNVPHLPLLDGHYAPDIKINITLFALKHHQLAKDLYAKQCPNIPTVNFKDKNNSLSFQQYYHNNNWVFIKNLNGDFNSSCRPLNIITILNHLDGFFSLIDSSHTPYALSNVSDIPLNFLSFRYLDTSSHNFDYIRTNSLSDSLSFLKQTYTKSFSKILPGSSTCISPPPVHGVISKYHSTQNINDRNKPVPLYSRPTYQSIQTWVNYKTLPSFAPTDYNSITNWVINNPILHPKPRPPSSNIYIPPFDFILLLFIIIINLPNLTLMVLINYLSLLFLIKI